jgi:hypothetical protein
MIGDTIKFTNLTPHEIIISGRTKFFLNVVGSQLSEEKMDKAILEVAKELSITVKLRNKKGTTILRNSLFLKKQKCSIAKEVATLLIPTH